MAANYAAAQYLFATVRTSTGPLPVYILNCCQNVVSYMVAFAFEAIRGTRPREGGPQ